MNRVARVLLILLRISIGWHFLYEGIFKIQSDTGSVSYDTSWYTLQTSLARLRDYYQHPPAGGFTVEAVAARADAWYDEVVKAFKARKSLDEGQKARLAELRDKVKLAAAAGEADIVNFDWDYVRNEVLGIAAAAEGDRFTSLGYLQASAGPLRPLFRSLVSDMDGLERLDTHNALARVDERHAEILVFFEKRGKPFDTGQRQRLEKARDSLKAALQATLDAPAWQARLADYRTMRQRVAALPTGAGTPFARERLDADRQKLDAIATEMLAYVNEPLAELAVQTQNITTVDQMGLGPLPRPRDASEWVDRGIKFSLTAIGICLLLGLFTPYAAAAATLQLIVFYLASPPWPGLPASTTAGHYLYIDRNWIEAIAAAYIAVSAKCKFHPAVGQDIVLCGLSSSAAVDRPQTTMSCPTGTEAQLR
jgi:uncharacterized membrane protein YphA (DoxX/SURF4 family)